MHRILQFDTKTILFITLFKSEYIIHIGNDCQKQRMLHTFTGDTREAWWHANC